METLNEIVTSIGNFVWEFGIPGEWIGLSGNATIPFIVIFLVGVGIFLTLRLGFVQIRRFWHGAKVTSGIYDDPDEPGDVSHFAALTTALSATVGIGNIAGVAVAIHWGGPGALFWMWVTAFLGMCTKFTEVTLAQKHRDQFDPDDAEDEAQRKLLGSVSGGPMYYIRKGLGSNWKWMAVLAAVLLGTVAFFTGNAVQANVVSRVMQADFGIPLWITGLFTTTVIGVIIIGGIKRIGRVTSILAPLMAAIYVLGGLLVLALNYEQILPTLGNIVTQAFNPTAGIAGTGVGAVLVTMMWGVKQGLFSNESGMGSAPIAHSAAQTDEPVSEGSVAILEPFIDTIIICSITGLAILMTGVWDDKYPTEIALGSADATYVTVEPETGTMLGVNNQDLKPIPVVEGESAPGVGEPLELAWYNVSVGKIYLECLGVCDEQGDLQNLLTGTLYPARGVAVTEDGNEYETVYAVAVENGAALTGLAFTQGLSPLGDWGGYIVTIAVLLFAISTAISWNYYGNRCAIYLFGEKAVLPYNIIYVAIHFIGATLALSTIWGIGYIFLGLVILPNLLALVLLSGDVRGYMKSYFKREPWRENYEKHKHIKEQEKRDKDEER